MATELKERIVVSDETGFAVWTRREYESYIKGCAIAGAAPAYWIVTHFDEDEKLLSPSTPLSVEEAAKIKSDLIWEMIMENQDADDDTFTKQDIEVALYGWLEKVDPKSQRKKPPTPIPSDIVQALEAANPYPHMEDLPWNPASAKTGYNTCISKLRELLSSQKIIEGLSGELIQESQTVTTAEGLPSQGSMQEIIDILAECDQYLSEQQFVEGRATSLNSIGAGSILHKKIKQAIQSYNAGNQTEKEEEKS